MMVSRLAIEKVINEEEEVIYDNEFMPKSYDINFENICFSYDNDEQVLENISFIAENQKLTAIVGDSGSGKSTILNLIAKYYKPKSGNIKIGNIAINNIDASKVLRDISIVDQDVFLFNDTVKKIFFMLEKLQ
jgi:ATP-binding cassette, subfamily B, bacterial IrtB/YbtQ